MTIRPSAQNPPNFMWIAPVLAVIAGMVAGSIVGYAVGRRVDPAGSAANNTTNVASPHMYALVIENYYTYNIVTLDKISINVPIAVILSHDNVSSVLNRIFPGNNVLKTHNTYAGDVNGKLRDSGLYYVSRWGASGDFAEFCA